METDLPATQGGQGIDCRRGSVIAGDPFRGRGEVKFSKESFEYIKAEIETAYEVMIEGTPENLNFLAVELSMNLVLREIESVRRASEK